MIEFYAQIRYVHILSAIASGTLFAIRGAAVLFGARWPLSLPVRWLSYAIDTTLLTAALMLLTVLPWAMFGNGWLGLKVALIVVYIVLASFALRRARTRRTQAAFYAAALMTFAFVFTIARAHHPLGFLHPVLSFLERGHQPTAISAASLKNAGQRLRDLHRQPSTP